MDIKALAFDFDGLILDTETTSYHAYRDVFRYYGQDISFDKWQCWVGGIHTHTLACDYLEELLEQRIDRDEVIQLEKRIFQEMILSQDLLPGVVDVLEAGKRMGLKLALASSASSEWAIGHLKRYDLVAYFDVLQTRDDAIYVKPHPEIYQKAIQALGVNPREMIAFEDSQVGTLAAKAAGAYCVAVPNSMTKHHAFEHVDLRLSSLCEMPLEDMINLVE
ncbi:HAD family hydrolase [Paenibacillus marinisediminis]